MNRRIFPLYVVVFVGFLGYSLMIATFTPMILRNDNGMLPANSSLTERSLLLGVLLALYPLGQFLGSPVLGALSDRYGRRPILIASLSSTTILYVGIAAALVIRNLPLLMLACFLAGLSESNIVLAQGAIADTASRDDRSRLFGYVYLSASLAYVIGPLGGGQLSDHSIVSWFSYATPYWVVTVLLGATSLAVIVWFRETHLGTGQRGHLVESFTNLAVSSRTAGCAPSTSSTSCCICRSSASSASTPCTSSMNSTWEWGGSRSMWPSSPSRSWSPMSGSSAHCHDTPGPGRWCSSARSAMGLLMAVIVIPRSTAALWFTLGATALALAICLPSCAAMLSLAASDQEQGRAMGNNQSMQVGAESLSGLVGGGLAALVITLPLLVFAGVAVTGSLMLANLGRRKSPTPTIPVLDVDLGSPSL